MIVYVVDGYDEATGKVILHVRTSRSKAERKLLKIADRYPDAWIGISKRKVK